MLLGLDVGTSGLKGIAVDPQDGRVVATAAREYPLHVPRPGWAEQDAEDFARGAVEVLAEIGGRLGPRARDVRSVGLSGQMHTAVLLDDRREVVRRAILWCDTRTAEACREIREAIGREGLARTVGNDALEGFTLPKLVWLRRHEPDALARTRTVLMPKDYVAWRLSGAVSTEVSDASGTLAFEPARRAWSAEVLGRVGLDASIFPDAGESPSVAGTLLGDVARAAGLPAGVVVARGAADNAAGAVGLGVVGPRAGMVSIGTSGVVLAPTASFEVDPALRLHAFCHAVPGRFYLMGVMLAAGGALRWYRDALCEAERRDAEARGVDPYDIVAAEAERSVPGARGLVFLPYVLGERTPHADPDARACLVGLTARTGRDDVSRAVLEGITYGLADSLDLILALDRPPPLSELRLTGGGARSAFWRRLTADVLGVEIAVASSTEGPAFGAAILGGVAAGVFATVEEAAGRLVRVVERIAPDAARHTRYREVHAAYRALYGDLRERFRDLGRVEGR